MALLKRTQLLQEDRLVQELDLLLSQQVFQVAEQVRASVRAEDIVMISNPQLVEVLLDDSSAVLVAHDFANSVLVDNPRNLLTDPLETQRRLLRSRPTLHPVNDNRAIGCLVQDG
jgi:hypothetical protein